MCGEEPIDGPKVEIPIKMNDASEGAICLLTTLQEEWWFDFAIVLKDYTKKDLKEFLYELTHNEHFDEVFTDSSDLIKTLEALLKLNERKGLNEFVSKEEDITEAQIPLDKFIKVIK